MQDQREQILPINLEDEFKNSYLDYAMSVIVGRALPDVRDGLKPVHRRIIYAMKDLNLHHNRPYVKSAKIVGETMGKYHPHGDTAIYDTLVRMAQDFSLRYTLVDGQGNFGSVDGDPAAAMRYTEARMDRITEELLVDIDKETVDFRPNYDGKELEPEVLPCAYPNLLVNGSGGIAVGMATNIPPHNLREVINALVHVIDNPEAKIEDIMKFIPGPDFPTGGFIVGRAGIHDAYRTGRGKITVRAKICTEQLKNGKEAIIITEIPYQVNKTKVIETIAHLVKDKKIEGISDLRDESDRDGMRIVIEVKRNENAQVIINQLLKHTQLEDTFGVILLALVENKPRYLSLMKILHHFLDHRREVVIRRTRFELDKAEKKLHVLEGLKIAIDNIDAVIKLIRGSKDTESARAGLMHSFKLSEIQANAILDMRLQRLTALEINKIIDEINELKKFIDHCKMVLATPRMVMAIIKDELILIKEKYGDERRTEIIDAEGELTIEDLIAEERMVVTISHEGYIKRTPTDLYRKQRRGGRGHSGMETKEEDWVEHLFIGTTHDYILFFSNKGKAYWLKVYEIPQGGRATKGRPIVNMINIEEGEKVEAMIPVKNFEANYFIIMATKKGQIVKNELSLYSNPRATGIKAIKIDDDDELVNVNMTNGNQEIFMGTRDGMAIRFHETEVRPTGRFTGGVKGINITKDNYVVGMEVIRPNTTLLTVCENGYGKRTEIDQYRITHRGGKGVINIKTSDRNGKVVTIKEVLEDDHLMAITQSGIAIRFPVNQVRSISRNTQGVRLINLDEGDRITNIARMEDEDEIDENTVDENGIPIKIAAPGIADEAKTPGLFDAEEEIEDGEEPEDEGDDQQ